MSPLRRTWIGPMLAVLVAAPAGSPARTPAAVDWRILIRPHDRTRLRDWRQTWTAALVNARAGGAGARIAEEGVLLQPDAAIAPPEPPDGDYRCRTIRVGALQAGAPPYVAGASVACRIADGRFRMLGGLQRPAGRFWRLDGLRLVFLGAVALGDESGALDYGRDPDRDAVGVLERIAPDRWRLALPRPQWQSLMDIIEIVPAAPAAQAGAG